MWFIELIYLKLLLLHVITPVVMECSVIHEVQLQPLIVSSVTGLPQGNWELTNDTLMGWCESQIRESWYVDIHHRDDSRFATSQWEMALLCNDVTHWLGTNLQNIGTALSNQKYKPLTIIWHWVMKQWYWWLSARLQYRNGDTVVLC